MPPVPRKRIALTVRNDIIDWLLASQIQWSGAQDEVAFLSPMFDLASLPSTDHRKAQFPTAAEDIYQHRVNNPYDWDDDWVFSDARFNIRHSDDDLFLKFLVATVNPATGRDSATAAKMVQAYNDALRRVGFEVREASRIGDRVTYRAAKITGHHTPSELELEDVLQDEVLATHLRRLSRDLDADPAAAIDHCKSLLESQCKMALDGLEIAYSKSDDLPSLYARVSEGLGVHATSPSSAASKAIRSLHGGLTRIVQTIAEARNELGSGHGRSTPSVAERHHARLVFNETVAVAEYLRDAWSRRDLR